MTVAQQVIEAGLRLIAADVTDGTTGNVSARDGDDFIITPTSMDYRMLVPADLVRVNFESGEFVGRWQPSSEWRLHAEVYRARPDVGAVIHHHATWCTAVAVAGRAIPVLVDEAADIGPIPTARYAPPASAELAEVVAGEIAAGRNAILMANHGALAVGASVIESLRRALALERLAKIFIAAEMLGGARGLDDKAVTESRQFFARYRLHHDQFPSPTYAVPARVSLHDLMAYSFRAGMTFMSLLQAIVLRRPSRQSAAHWLSAP